MTKARNYAHEYAAYQGTPTQIHNRSLRNHARLEATKRLGHAPSGDVAHIRPLASGGSNSSGNERIEPIAKNRGWRKGQRGYHVPIDN